MDRNARNVITGVAALKENQGDVLNLCRFIDARHVELEHASAAQVLPRHTNKQAVAF